MSISSIQKNNKTDEFIQELVKKGIEPNNYELNKMLTEHFDNHVMGMPYYSPILQEPYGQSSKKDYNHNFSTLGEDLNTIYDASNELNSKAIALQSTYETEKTKVINAIKELSLKTDNVLEAATSGVKTKQYVESFDDLYGTELYGDKKRNIPYTTCFTDLLQKCLYTKKMNSAVNRLSMPDATVEINDYDFISMSTEGSKENILSDVVTENFLLYGCTYDDTRNSITIDVDLGKVMEFNTVMFRFTSIRDLTCLLYLSEDGENFVKVYELQGSELLEWNFQAHEARYLKIQCIKDEPDGINEQQNGSDIYEYYYMLKNISIAFEKYTQTSTFVSKVIEFDGLADTIRLDAEDGIFNNTRIDYFIGFDNGTDKVGWDNLPNHKNYPLYMFEKRHRIANFSLAEFNNADRVMDMYCVMEIPENTNRNSIKVIPGYNMWDVKQYNRKDGDFNDGYGLISNDFTEHIEKCDRTQKFMDCEAYDKFRLQSNVLYIFTQYVSLENAASLYNTFIKVMDPECRIPCGQEQIKVFLNGYEITPGDGGLYSFGLKKGTNKVQIALYIPSEVATEYRLYHNINFKSLTNDVFAMPPMKYTSNSIMGKAVGKTYNYYTIRNNKIYVKVPPADLLADLSDDMGYFVKYTALREDLTGYFKDNNLKFRIMAVLNSNDRNVSPRLLNFRITGR